jgi:4-amino-4-deoxy-L-arabinose transferase-like glycosyltransferase
MRRMSCWILLAIILGSIFLLAKLPQGDLAGYDDAVYAHMAKNMVRSGDWWNVCFNGEMDPENPPMLIWLQAVSMKALGVSDFAAKLPSALCGIAIIPLVYLIGRKIFADHWTPLTGMLIMLMTPYFLKYATHAMTDVPFTLFCTAAVWLYLCSIDRPVLMPMAGLFIAFAILTRSAIGLMPLLFIIVHLMTTGRLRKLILPMSGCILIALAIPAVWFVSMSKLHPNFWNGHLGFILSKTPPSEGSLFSWFLGLFRYPYLLAKNYWPWALFAAIGVWKYSRRVGKSGEALILILWAASVVVPLSFAGSKVLRYIMPAFPAFSLLSAAVFSEWIPKKSKLQVVKWTFAALIVIAAGYVLLPIDARKDRAVEARALVSILERQPAESERVLFYSRGAIRWDLRNQLVWYGDHPVDLLLTLDEARRELAAGRYSLAIFDNETYRDMQRKSDRASHNIGHSENYVCLAYPK